MQRSISPEAIAAKKIISLLFDEAKHKLVHAEGEEVLRLQGEARAYDKLYRELTVPSASAVKE